MAGQERALMRVHDAVDPEALLARLLEIERRAAGDHGDDRRGDRELLPGPAAPPDRHFVFMRGVQAGVDLPLQRLAGRHAGELALQVPADRAELGKIGPALRAGLEMLLEGDGRDGVELAVEIEMERFAVHDESQGIEHAHPTASFSWVCNSFRPRAIRDMTVPIGTSSTAAISL